MDLKSTYNKIAKDWHKDHLNDDWWCEGTDKFALLLPKGSYVLDVGCGAGVKTKYLIDKGLNVLGFDFSEGLLKIAKKNAPKARFILLDIYNLEKIPKKFDGVFAQAVLLHFPKKDIPMIISKLYDRLKPNGLLYIAVKEKNEDQKEEEIKTENDYGYEYQRFFSFFTLDEVINYLKKPNLKIIFQDVKFSGHTNWIQVIAQKTKEI